MTLALAMPSGLGACAHRSWYAGITLVRRHIQDAHQDEGRSYPPRPAHVRPYQRDSAPVPTEFDAALRPVGPARPFSAARSSRRPWNR